MWPALDVPGAGNSDLLLADLDDYFPTAVEERGDTIRVFFSTTEARGRALEQLTRLGRAASAVDVSDEDWAKRSQDALQPITVGRIRVTPPWHQHKAHRSGLETEGQELTVVIQPSMGFGTGHHATTRLCLAALQAIDVSGKDVLDVGTGSGVLAIAARMLGARHSKGIDNDADAIQSARENLGLNPAVESVVFDLDELAGVVVGSADVVLANLTGALLERSAPALLAAARPGGRVVVSGLMIHEQGAIEAAFAPAHLLQAWAEDEWAALAWAV
jgi:ribosomal protein L11 methyltransferase